MRRYRLNHGHRLLFSVDLADWEEIVFRKSDFGDIGKATADEVADVCLRPKSLNAWVNDDGDAVIAAASNGGHASLEVDLTRSTAAPALGLTASAASAQGSGPQAARLVSAKPGPYRLPAGGRMSLNVDGRKSAIEFPDEVTGKDVGADDVAKAINSKVRKRVAYAGRDGRVVLQSLTVGAGSALEVQPGGGRGKADAAEPLGFVGEAALSDPHPVAPPMLELSGRPVELRASNLTVTPIELHFPTGVAVLPPHGSLPLTGGEAAHLPLQRLVSEGAVALAAAPGEPESNEEGA